MLQRTNIRVMSALALLACTLTATAAPAENCAPWPEWDSFRLKFVSEDGRVIDRSISQQVTTSEGQSYALMFALIANDRPSFDRILHWTEDNLAGGDLTARLPAWQWGQLPNGGWGVIDSNAASDADLWIAYALNEAGGLWNVPRYSALGELLAARILREETAELPGLGLALLPAPQGFHADETTWRLNPSYYPIQILRRFATLYPKSGWEMLASNSVEIIIQSTAEGFVPEWVNYQPDKGFTADSDPVVTGVGYNAIRVYLWAGMLDKQDRAYPVLLEKLSPMGRHITSNGTTGAISKAGFSAALLPFLKSLKLGDTLHQQNRRVIALSPLDKSDNYYDQVLTLFGLGWLEGHYRFDRNGKLLPRWKCTKN